MRCASIHTHPASHAGYYLGAEAMSLQLVLDPRDRRILGAQAVVGAGVEKRIDVLATAMGGGLTAPQLAELELAYAPPFGSAKDPANMLGYVAETPLERPDKRVSVLELTGEDLFVDVRTPEEHAAGAIPGSVNIPVDELRDRVGELGGRRVVVDCQVGLRPHRHPTACATSAWRPATSTAGGEPGPRRSHPHHYPGGYTGGGGIDMEMDAAEAAPVLNRLRRAEGQLRA